MGTDRTPSEQKLAKIEAKLKKAVDMMRTETRRCTVKPLSPEQEKKMVAALVAVRTRCHGPSMETLLKAKEPIQGSGGEEYITGRQIADEYGWGSILPAIFDLMRKGLLRPFKSNGRDRFESFDEFIAWYRESSQFQELSTWYAENISNKDEEKEGVGRGRELDLDNEDDLSWLADEIPADLLFYKRDVLRYHSTLKRKSAVDQTYPPELATYQCKSLSTDGLMSRLITGYEIVDRGLLTAYELHQYIFEGKLFPVKLLGGPAERHISYRNVLLSAYVAGGWAHVSAGGPKDEWSDIVLSQEDSRKRDEWLSAKQQSETVLQNKVVSRQSEANTSEPSISSKEPNRISKAFLLRLPFFFSDVKCILEKMGTPSAQYAHFNPGVINLGDSTTPVQQEECQTPSLLPVQEMTVTPNDKRIVPVRGDLYKGKAPSVARNKLLEAGFDPAVIAYVLNKLMGVGKTRTGKLLYGFRDDFDYNDKEPTDKTYRNRVDKLIKDAGKYQIIPT